MTRNRQTTRNAPAAVAAGISAARICALIAFALLTFLFCLAPGQSWSASFTQAPLLGKQAQLARHDAQAAELRDAVPADDAEATGAPRPGPDFKIDRARASWRIRIFDAAAVPGVMVTLGDIAAPAGDLPQDLWERLKLAELWPAPADNGKSANFTRPRLQQAVTQSLGEEVAALCLYPPSITVQKGGLLLESGHLRQVVVSGLTPLVAALPGEPEFRDFRLPARVFLEHAGQKLELETPAKVAPGRLNLRFVVREADGSVARKLSGSVFMDCWATVPSAAAPLNKGALLLPEHVTFTRQNLAYLRELPWEGTGGPWRVARPLAPEQPILQGDLAYMPTVTKGKTVTLVYENSTVRLAVNAEALADGVKGESIPVRNLQSKRQVQAIVLDEHTVLSSRSAARTGTRPAVSALEGSGAVFSQKGGQGTEIF